MSTTELPAMLTTREVAAALRMAEYTVQRKCRRAELQGAIKVANDRWLVPASTVAEMLGLANA